MSIQLEPSELSFQRPFNREVTQTLRIKNTLYEPVAFKVKTTAPKQYCVRPNSGRVEAGETVEVQVHLQPMQKEPPLDYKCRDKFLVQSVPISADREAVNVQAIWSHVEKNEREAIKERKIRVIFLAEGQTASASASAGDVSFEPSSPQGHTDVMSTPAPSAPSKPASSKRESYAPSTDAASALSASGILDKDSDSLAAAKATIARLEEQLRDHEQRLRKAAESKLGGGNMGTLTTHPPEGVPVPITAGLCLLAFLLAWFFF